MSITFDRKDGTAFHGAKLALFIAGRLATILRDDKDNIPWPNYWDLPGGGREGGESGPACACRETAIPQFQSRLADYLAEIDTRP